MTETVRAWRDFPPDLLPLPHPSWRNTGWLKRNPWFEAEVAPYLREPVPASSPHEALLVLAVAAARSAPAPRWRCNSALPPRRFAGPRLEADRFISFDGAKLGLSPGTPAAASPGR